MTVVFGTTAAIYFRKKKIVALMIVFTGYYILERLFPWRMQSAVLLLGVAVRFVWALCFFGILFIYYYKRESYLLLSMLIAGISSQGAMIVSPTIYTRCHTMMEFVLHLMLAECIISIGCAVRKKQDKRSAIGYYFSAGLLCLYAFCNFCSIIGGYRRNGEIITINHGRLMETARNIEAGYTITEIELYKLYDDKYATNMPYQEGYDYIEGWMKDCYEIPYEVQFVWSDERV